MALQSAECGFSDRGLTAVRGEEFLRLLPTIRRAANFAFRGRSWSDRQDLVDEVIGHALVAFCRLVARGNTQIAYGTSLAAFAVKRVLDGRRVGTPDNACDVSSAYCRRRKGIRIQRLEEFDPRSGRWQELVVEDRRATPCELAITRLDVEDWFQKLPKPKRQLAKCLAIGESTDEVAKRFNLSPGRISQLRRELQQSWEDFQRDARQNGNPLLKNGSTSSANRSDRG
jgi:hypothetical protein